MADIIVGEKVINKSKEIGTIISFEDNIIVVDFKTRVAKLMSNAFDEGYLKYINIDLQSKIDDVKKAEKQKLEEERVLKEKSIKELKKVQDDLSRSHFRISVLSASIRLSPAKLTLTSVRKKDVDLVQKIFNECDKDIKQLYDSVEPKMEYLKYTPYSRSKYGVGFLCKYLDTYVFRVFSRNDIYKRKSSKITEISLSDVTEVLRVLCINGKLYYFSKNLSCAGEYLVNTKSHNNWHVSNLSNRLLLNEVIKNCDCEYLNDYISSQNVDCLQYTKLLFASFHNNKVEIVFKNKLFSSTYRIDDIVAYLDEFTSKQIDFASKNNLINALPVIKNYANLEIDILQNIELIMKKRRYGISIYNTLEQYLSTLGFVCSDLVKKLINFLKKIDRFDARVYYDYITELSNQPNITIKDFFDKNYIDRHNIMLAEKHVIYSRLDIERYQQIAQELSWIDREENGYFIILPKSISDFKYEGTIQHNCVYTNMYCKYVINRMSIIVFLRKEKDTPYVTIEFDYETFEVIQAYGKFNSDIDENLLKYIVELGKRLKYEMLSQQ